MDYQHAPLPNGLDHAALAAAIASINSRFAPEVWLDAHPERDVWVIKCRWLDPANPSIWVSVSETQVEWPIAHDPFLGEWLLNTVGTAIAVALGAVETWHDCTGEDERRPLDYLRRWPTYSQWESHLAARQPLRLLFAAARFLDRTRRQYVTFFDGLPPWEDRFLVPRQASGHTHDS